MILHQNTSLQQGKYVIEKELGQGGFGITYLALQKTLNRKVAIKEFFMREFCERNEETTFVTMGTKCSLVTVDYYRKQFRKEAEKIATLHHPNIVNIYDVFEENNTVYYVMEYLPGGSLDEHVKKYGALDAKTAKNYICQVSEALDYLHNIPVSDNPKQPKKMLHLDVKPSNIMINASGQAVLVDFGISKRYDENGDETDSGTPLGVSEGYAPLEQYEVGGIINFTPATDIYSLGATFLFLLTGNKPPKASLVLSKGLPNMDKSIPSNIQDAIRQTMSPDKLNRPQSIGLFLDLLNIKKPILKNKKLWAGIVVAIIITVLIFIFMDSPEEKAEKLLNEAVTYLEVPEENRNVPLAIEMITKAAELGHAEAMFCLGSIYVTDDFDVENEEMAVYWLKKAADAGYTDAKLALGVYYDDEVEEEKAVAYLLPLAKEGNAVAQRIIGGYYEEGEGGLKKNESLAVEWYTKAAEQGDAEAMYDLALCYLQGTGVEADKNKVLTWMQKSADLGYNWATLNLGKSYLMKTFTEVNFSLAEKYLRKTTETEHFWCTAESYYYLGLLESINDNHDKAFDYFYQAAERKQTKALCKVGEYYFIGIGKVEQNYDVAFKYFKEAADMNNAEAMYILGYCYACGNGVDKDEHTAIEYWEKSVNEKAPSPYAQLALAKVYEQGEFVERNMIKAVELYQKAANSDIDEVVKLARTELARLGYE